MTGTVTTATPRGGLARMSQRVMNLAHLVTQNARRHGDRIGFIWGDRSWTWREIDRAVSALAAALAERGIVRGDRLLVHSKNCDEMFWSMFAAFRLGAVWVPTNFRLMPDEVAYLATASGARGFLCHGDFPDHAKAVAQIDRHDDANNPAADRGADDGRREGRGSGQAIVVRRQQVPCGSAPLGGFGPGNRCGWRAGRWRSRGFLLTFGLGRSCRLLEA